MTNSNNTNNSNTVNSDLPKYTYMVYMNGSDLESGFSEDYGFYIVDYAQNEIYSDFMVFELTD